jgi:DNA-binding SARP family transcriptional activator
VGLYSDDPAVLLPYVLEEVADQLAALVGSVSTSQKLAKSSSSLRARSMWAEEEVRALRSTHVELLERTGHARLVTGDAHGALQAAQQGLALDNYNEGLSGRLAMQAESRLGLRDSITQRYQQLRDLLDEQLGLQPESATRALYHELLGQR